MKPAVSFQPLDKMRYFEQIAHLIRERIFSENLETGFKLPSEQKLAEELSVSRSVVREALRILDVMGYVVIKKGPQGGIFVSSNYHKPMRDSLKHLAVNGQINVNHLFDVRLHLEPYMALEAAKNATAVDIEKLENLFTESEKHLDDGTYLKARNLEFHLLLAEASGNPVLSIIMKSIVEINVDIAQTFLNPEFERKLLQVHKTIFKAVKEKKITEIEQLIRDDILFVKKNLKQSLQRED